MINMADSIPCPYIRTARADRRLLAGVLLADGRLRWREPRSLFSCESDDERRDEAKSGETPTTLPKTHNVNKDIRTCSPKAVSLRVQKNHY